MKNETNFIKSSKERTLTAKANKFKNRIIDMAAKQRGFTRYHQETKPLKDQINEVINHLFIDKNLTIEDIKVLIKNRKTSELTKLTNNPQQLNQ